MGNSTVRLQDSIDYCASFADLNSVIPASGYNVKKSLQVANAVMKKFLSSSLKWNFNRRKIAIGITSSWMQDYATNLTDVGFVQNGYLLEINNTAYPRPVWDLEAVQNPVETTHQYGRPGQIGALLNKDLQYGLWGATGIGTGGPQNPQPNSVITSPIGKTVSPANPILQVQDPNGNFWIVTTFGTTGSYGGSAPFYTQPPWPANPVYPSYASPNVIPTSFTDGSVVWTVVNPNNWGFRLAPLPPQTGVPYQIFPTYQMRPITFTSMGQFIEPIPDDYAPAFWDGLVAHFYQAVTDPKIRAKHADAVKLWEDGLLDSKKSQDRTRDQAIMVPSSNIMGSYDVYMPNAAMPLGPAF